MYSLTYTTWLTFIRACWKVRPAWHQIFRPIFRRDLIAEPRVKTVIEARGTEECPTECLQRQVVGSGVFNESLFLHTALSHETITCQETAKTNSTLSNLVSQHAASRHHPVPRPTSPSLLHFLLHCYQISSQCGAKNLVPRGEHFPACSK